MQVTKLEPLAQHSTMRLGGKAAYAVEIHNRMELSEAMDWAAQYQLPVIMVGSGSNIVWRDEGFNGLLLINKVAGYNAYEEDAENYYITVGAGEIWDGVVAKAVAAGASGIECLSLIPGTTGATPIQNVGAYGQEIAETLVSIEAYDSHEKKFVTLANQDCAFGYRTSRFKTTDRGRFMIMGITLHLMKTNPSPPFYASLQTYLKANKIQEFTPQIIRNAVIAIRQSKLPDPSEVANCGSFFGNPIIERGQLDSLIQDYSGIIYWETDATHVKLSAAWLIEQAGFKNFHSEETGMETWPTQTLVLVNKNAKTTNDLLAFKQMIVEKVKQQFNVVLEQEPELLP